MISVTQDTFFGTPEQQALLRRGRGLHDLMRDDPRLFYYGRTVAILRPGPDSDALLGPLIAIQGATTYCDIAPEAAPALRATLEARGYAVTEYARWTGGAEALAASREILARHTLPEGISVRVIGPGSPESDLALLAQVALSCGVLPTAGSMLRGVTRPGLSLVAVTDAGQPVACSAAAAHAHPSDPEFGREAWWGMLATDPDHRGKRLALTLGAMAMVEMHDRHGFTRFMTGVVPGNAASEAVCAKCGLADRGQRIFTVVDPSALAGGKMTS